MHISWHIPGYFLFLCFCFAQITILSLIICNCILWFFVARWSSPHMLLWVLNYVCIAETVYDHMCFDARLTHTKLKIQWMTHGCGCGCCMSPTSLLRASYKNVVDFIEDMFLFHSYHTRSIVTPSCTLYLKCRTHYIYMLKVTCTFFLDLYYPKLTFLTSTNDIICIVK